MLFAHPLLMRDLCKEIAYEFAGQVEAVLAPTTVLSSRVAEALFSDFKASREVLALTTDKSKELPGSLILRRGYQNLIRGKRVLVVDDVTTSGGTLLQLAALVVKHGGILVGAGCICNRGRLTAVKVGVPRLFSVIQAPSVKAKIWTKRECLEAGPCSRKIPLDTELGHGKGEKTLQAKK